MADQYQRLMARVDALVLRERALLLIASIVFIFFVTDSFAFQPIYAKQQVLLQDIREQEIQLELLRVRTMLRSSDNNDVQSPSLTQLQQKLNNFGEQLEFRLDSMLSPETASSVLEQIIVEEKGLALISVSTRQTQLSLADEYTENSSVVDDINRHELELEFEGTYLDTLRYLRTLEALPWKFLWERISFSITDYPVASVDLEIYTLGSAGI